MKRPLKGKPFAAIAIITASGVTALFIAVWAVSGTVNLASSIITLGVARSRYRRRYRRNRTRRKEKRK